MTRDTLSHALAFHASVARYGVDAGTRGPMQRWQDQGVPKWWVLPTMCACFALGWWIAK